MKPLRASILFIGFCVVSRSSQFGTEKRRLVKTVPDYNKKDIVREWGYPAEIVLEPYVLKSGRRIETWYYYFEDENGNTRHTHFSFRNGKWISSLADDKLIGYRLMDVTNSSDFDKIMAEKKGGITNNEAW